MVNNQTFPSKIIPVLLFSQTTKSTTGKTVNVLRVCCAIKRRLQFFYWKPYILESPDFSIELKDVPKALCWVDDLICVGYKDEYVIFNVSSFSNKNILFFNFSLQYKF